MSLSDNTISDTMPCPSSDLPSAKCIQSEIDDERTLQDEKWGQQDHENGTGPLYAIPAKNAKAVCQAAPFDGTLTWDKILLEETFEALECEDDEQLRAELIQLAAVAVAWIECIDRRVKK